jgi:FkbM family methyltransferase
MSASNPLIALLQPERLTAVVDIGANPIDAAPSYKGMLAAGWCNVVGFEPQPDGLRRLLASAGPNERYLPYAVGDGTPKTLHLCAAQGMSSLRKPDPARLALFNLFPIWGSVKATLPVVTRKLDEISEIAAMDLLKMDIQGSEHDVLAHGRARVAQAVVIETEVSFMPLYEGQPTYGETDTLLRSLGFIPHSFTEAKIWPLAPMVVKGEQMQGIRQLLEADMVYVRDFTRAGNMSAEQWKQLALIAHYCYGSFDLVLRAILMLEELGAVPAGSADRYLSLCPDQISRC